MFFIGVFGIEETQKQLATYNNAICPGCGAMTRFEIFKSYSYFHIFFIPTFRWNIRYYIRPVCCGRIYELDPATGQQVERGENPEIRDEHLRPANQYLPYKTCSHCGVRVEPEYSFCPYCGRRL
ncbi:MAG: zinc ribbon domain-containing protein [Clostridiales bacterium]|jgi:RNA polymerase subunit RPABC4/transcription elongation factor Spt4|nr:zinc ribbon domain-containing protein [Eubacteriales bacterium]MDH7565326.1 zinc ribbon domain-containing protein [Clostridiales bacterium]